MGKTAANNRVINRTIFTGDNLPIMRGMATKSIDMIYLDPPFNSNHNYSAPIGSRAAGAHFKDTWTLNDVDVAWWGEVAEANMPLYKVLDAAGSTGGNSVKSYLIYMAIRIMEMHRLLKDDGSLYLHCDSTMSHYLKLTLDAVFGAGAFMADITWRRTFAHNDRMFGSLSDNLLYYAKGDGAATNTEAVTVPFTIAEIAKKYTKSDGRGRYMRDNLMAAQTSDGESGKAWKGCDPTSYGRHWSAPLTGKYAEYIDKRLIPGYRQIKGIHARLDALDANGLIIWPKRRKGKKGAPTLKRYALPGQGTVPGDIWTDIQPMPRMSKERLGYPTQKPLALLERIIAASSDRGDWVLDPFCGCATTCSAAEKLGRKWIGIDISPKAYELVLTRLKNEAGLAKFTRAAGMVTHRSDIPIRHGTRSPDIKKELYGRQMGKCNGCEHLFDYRHMEVDHIVPSAKGGQDIDENKQLLCSHCNRVKGKRLGMDELKVRLREMGILQ